MHIIRPAWHWPDAEFNEALLTLGQNTMFHIIIPYHGLNARMPVIFRTSYNMTINTTYVSSEQACIKALDLVLINSFVTIWVSDTRAYFKESLQLRRNENVWPQKFAQAISSYLSFIIHSTFSQHFSIFTPLFHTPTSKFTTTTAQLPFYNCKLHFITAEIIISRTLKYALLSDRDLPITNITRQ